MNGFENKYWRSFLNRSLFFSLILFSVCICFGQETGDSNDGIFERDKIAQEVGSKWIEVGVKQLQRNMFDAAEKSLLHAQDYEKYLNEDERAHLVNLLTSVRQALSVRAEALSEVKQADALLGQGQILQAKAHLEKAQKSNYLTELEKRLVSENMAKLNVKIAKLKSDADYIYNQSVENYNNGQLAKARKGFILLAKGGFFNRASVLTPEEYISRIDNVLGISVQSLDKEPAEDSKAEIVSDPCDEIGQVAEEMVANGLLDSGVQIESSDLEPCGESSVCTKIDVIDKSDVNSMLEIANPSDDEEQYNDAISRKRKVLRSYAKASVKEAVSDVVNYIKDGRYYKAEKAFKAAEDSLDANRIQIGEEAFKEYRDQLDQVQSQIQKSRDSWIGQ